ncbi:MAG: flavodoxin-dependent (E)-4-hydroxy-3-methylbut-2-enyl-diphosphate synthase [Vallitaleaceae bacterium]|jgi:(E)-4-hydroxy-3-methylbut-2-enyl-diphosphate synthase|nr:flavodoxin-dependent (E)-4-hydroxy-3-methylbut-2-enyl-diphosphate synthase [Vallitaleaceae bacterium]
MKRLDTRSIQIKDVTIGSKHPILIQSMCNTKTEDIESTVKQILGLEAVGCDIIRVSVPSRQAAAAIKSIKAQIHIPIVADIHFDYRLAIASVENGADKIRINPGNIGSRERLKAVVDACVLHQIPIRVGVNSGSLEKYLLEKYGSPTAAALAESALNQVRLIEKLGYENLVVSIKASDVTKTLKAYQLFSKQKNYPLHIGITEAGTVFAGSIKSAVGLGILLSEGIGDTIRVSLTSDPIEEVKVAKEILKSLGLRKDGIEFISCPTCGRTNIDLISLAKAVEERCAHIKKPIKVAVMGCAVNGPGEAREADIGIAGGDGEGLIFKKGKIFKKVKEADLLEALLEEINALE